jgi:hypothetical protein
MQPDHAGQVEPERAGQERQPTAKAETDREEVAVRASGAKRRGRRRHVVAQLPVAELVDVLRVREVLGSIGGRLRGPAEVVDREGPETVLGKAAGQLLVVRVQAAHIGQHEDGGGGVALGHGLETGEARPVGGLQVVRPGAGNRAVTGQDRRAAAAVEAHQASSLAASSSSARRAPPCAGGCHA